MKSFTTTISTIYITGIFLTLCIHARRDCPRSCTCADGSTTDIYQVDCSGQGLQELPSKSISTMTSLLNLNSNRLSSVSRESFSGLRWLLSLNMSFNEISWIEEDSFKYMTRLDILDLSHNKLTTISTGIFNGLQSLKELNLAHNELTEVGGAFTDLVNLTKLDVSDNRLTSLTEFTLRDLRSLKFLHLSNNLIHTIDRKAFRNQQRLHYLVLRNNPLNIRRFYFHAQLLSSLDLSECHLTQVPGGLSDSIRYLQLRRNNITTLSADSFSDCPYVNVLILDENQLTSVDDSTFEKMYHLLQLWLNDNKLERLPRYLPSNLRRLLADGNRIKRIMNVFPPRSQMSTISLVGNDIRQVEKDAFSNLATLHNLDLSDNYITHIYSGTFTYNTQLRSLKYSKNPIRHFTPGCFTGLSDLQSLSLGFLRRGMAKEEALGGNDAENDPELLELHSDLFQPLHRLQRLELDNSASLISTVLNSERLLEGLRSLVELSMRGSDMTSLTQDFLQLLPSLAALHISSSRWHCDQSLFWFRDFLRSTRIKIESKEEIKCFTPRALHGRPIMSLRDDEFVTTTTLVPLIVSKLPINRVPEPEGPAPAGKPYREDGWMEYEILEPDRIPGKDSNRNQTDRKNSDKEGNDVIDQKKGGDDGSRSIFLIAISRSFGSTRAPPLGVWHMGGVEAADRGWESRRRNDDHHSNELEVRVMVVVVTVVATCVVAAIIIALIIYVWNRQQQQLVDDSGLSPAAVAANQQLRQKEQHERTIISYKNKSGVLYFSSSSSGGRKSSAAAAELRCEDTRGGDSSSSSQSLLTSQATTPTMVTSSHSLPEVHLINKPAKYYKTRVYKWEDF